MKTDHAQPTSGFEIRFGHEGRVLTIPEAWMSSWRGGLRAVLHEPFRGRPWRELSYFAISGVLAALGLALLAITLASGVTLLVTVVGAAVVGISLRFARSVGRWHRSLARRMGVAEVAEPEPFVPGHGFFGWIQSAMRDRVGWRAMAYSILKAILWAFGVWFALSVWWDAAICLLHPFASASPHAWGIVRSFFSPGYLSVGNAGFIHGTFIFVTGILFLFLAPWPMRLVVTADRWLLAHLLSPDPVTARLRTLEAARSQTIDASAATLRRIERDLHDGTQAQLVALAMQLGQAKEKLASANGTDLAGARRLVDDAHRGTKEAIAELRDLVRGIHPPVLDTGLEGALSTLAARSSVPTRLDVSLADRPSPAIEAIAYFCAAELLANVAQHAGASRAVVSCVQEGGRLRLAVSDDGVGGACATAGDQAVSSGLAGLTERVRAVDGFFHVASPPGGPTVVTVGLPLRT
jgi:signal transduction histidine kinase